MASLKIWHACDIQIKVFKFFEKVNAHVGIIIFHKLCVNGDLCLII